MYAKLKTFQATLKQSYGSMYVHFALSDGINFEQVPWRYRPSLYFVKVDVQACFDSINQDKLLEILEEILSSVYSKVWKRLNGY